MREYACAGQRSGTSDREKAGKGKQKAGKGKESRGNGNLRLDIVSAAGARREVPGWPVGVVKDDERPVLEPVPGYR